MYSTKLFGSNRYFLCKFVFSEKTKCLNICLSFVVKMGATQIHHSLIPPPTPPTPSPSNYFTIHRIFQESLNFLVFIFSSSKSSGLGPVSEETQTYADSFYVVLTYSMSPFDKPGLTST